MCPLSSRLTALAAALLLTMPIITRAQEGLTVADFASQNNPSARSLTDPGSLRRGTTSTVRIIKNLIDLVPDQQITVLGGASRGVVRRGHASAGTGYIEMSITVPAAQGIGSTVTINVGFLDHFAFDIVHKALIGTVVFDPNPTTIAAGTFTVIVIGTDFGNPELTGLSCHTQTNRSVRSDRLSVQLTRNASAACASNGETYSFSLKSTTAGDPSIYANSSGGGTFAFGPYIVPPPPAAPCFSQPNIGVPAIIAPTNHQEIVFSDGRATQSVTMKWQPTTDNGSAPPNGEWNVKLSRQGDPTAFIHNFQIYATTTTLTTIVFDNLPVPGVYTATIRARNCGQFAPSSSVNFQFSSANP